MVEITMSTSTKQFIACGMYAFTDPQRRAWQAFFDEFLNIIELRDAVESTIRFEADFDLLRSPGLLLGHTCGYPLMHYLRDHCQPVCVPCFDVEGSNGKYYSSHIITSVDSDINALADCYNKIAVINGHDSNSGMNVLRHAVALLDIKPPFFSKVEESGSHFNSLLAVADRQADVTAIDCVSFALIKDENPELVSRVETIAFSQATCGLPFVIPHSANENFEPKNITKALNQALNRVSDNHRQTLHLAGFKNVTLADFQSIIDLETVAFEGGYTKLQ